MAFGFGISDFMAVGQVAWKIGVSCKAAPEVFGNISQELESLHCVLEEAAETLSSHPLAPRRQARLKTTLDGCISVLGDLQYIVQKYQSLGTDEKSAWDRLRLGGEDIAEIRSRLNFNITLLTAFRSIVIGTTSTQDRPPPEREYGSWQWVVELSEPEVLESPRRSSVPDKRFSRAETDTTTLVDAHQVSPPPKSKSRPRLGSLTTRFSSPKKQLISAVDHQDLDKAVSILSEPLTIKVLDQDLLDRALWGAVRFSSQPLIVDLLARGANIDAVYNGKSTLWNAVAANNKDAVNLLICRKVNLKSDHLPNNSLPLRAALKSDPIMSLLARTGTPLNIEYQPSSTIRMNVLQEAVSLGRESITRILLNEGASVNASSSTHGTALIIALSMGRESLARLLIQNGADVNIPLPTSASYSYTNPVEAAIIGRKPSLLKLLFRAGAVTDIPQAIKFAQANSEYSLIPGPGSQYSYNYDGTRKLYKTMVMLAQRDLRYICFFRKSDGVEAKRDGLRRIMNDLCKTT